MLGIFTQIEEAVAKIRSKWNKVPHAGIILGTGLGGLVEQIAVEATLDYEEIPHFPKSTATSHRAVAIVAFADGHTANIWTAATHQNFGRETESQLKLL